MRVRRQNSTLIWNRSLNQINPVVTTRKPIIKITSRPSTPECHSLGQIMGIGYETQKTLPESQKAFLPSPAAPSSAIRERKTTECSYRVKTLNPKASKRQTETDGSCPPSLNTAQGSCGACAAGCHPSRAPMGTRERRLCREGGGPGSGGTRARAGRPLVPQERDENEDSQ